MQNGEVTIHCNKDKRYDTRSNGLAPQEVNKLTRDFSYCPWDPGQASIQEFYLGGQGST